MYPRKPLSHGEQLARLKTYLRRARTDLRHRYDEFFEVTGKRRDCPLEVRIRSQAIDQAQSTVKLLEACVEEIQRQEAMFYAPFKPGDRIEVARAAGEAFNAYFVVDVLPDKRPRYRYECVALTKKGAMSKRGTRIGVWPKATSTIRTSEIPLNADGQWESVNRPGPCRHL